jgi:transposase-like protein
MGRPAGWTTAVRGRPAMRSPGKPPVRRDAERAFWKKIAEGLTREDAAVACGVSGPVGSRWFRERGGMPSIQLDPVSGRYLSFEEREDIALLKAQDAGVREIARQLGRDPSTISRELRRNAATRCRQFTYRASVAQWKAELAAQRPKRSKLAGNERLREYVQDRLAGELRHPDGTPVAGPTAPRWKGRNKPRRQDRRWATSWSPQQISHRLTADFPDDESMRISHEAIYQALYIQGRGVLKRELVACLRTGRALRVPRARTGGRGKKFVTAELLISQRPAEAEDRAVPGHWEGDLIIGLIDDDRIPNIVPSFRERTAGLPEPMTGELTTWFELKLSGSTTAPRVKARPHRWILRMVTNALPALRMWADQGKDSLRSITRADVVAVLPDSGTARVDMLQGLRHIVRPLKNQRIIFTDPTARIFCGMPTTTIACSSRSTTSVKPSTTRKYREQPWPPWPSFTRSPPDNCAS